jgi:hypothetical protein
MVLMRILRCVSELIDSSQWLEVTLVFVRWPGVLHHSQGAASHVCATKGWPHAIVNTAGSELNECMNRNLGVFKPIRHVMISLVDQLEIQSVQYLM